MPSPQPPRVTFGALSTGTTMSAQYNPETLEEDLAVVYQKIKVQGLSHTVLQYEHTESWACSFDLAFDSYSVSLARGLSDDIQQARNFLQSMCYPQRGSGNIASAAPSRLQFVWPGMISLTAVVNSLKFKHKRFAWTGVDLKSTLFVVSMKIEEIRDTRLYADDVLNRGTQRAST